MYIQIKLIVMLRQFMLSGHVKSPSAETSRLYLKSYKLIHLSLYFKSTLLKQIELIYNIKCSYNEWYIINGVEF